MSTPDTEHDVTGAPVVKYEIPVTLQAELVNRFRYHAPMGDQPQRYERIRDEIFKLAVFICQNAPDSRERATALTHLDHAMMMANAAIARNEPTGVKLAGS